MILGIGSDLIDVRRIERTIERHGEKFLGRIFTATERATADRSWEWPARTVARLLEQDLRERTDWLARWECELGAVSAWPWEPDQVNVFLFHPGRSAIREGRPWLQFRMILAVSSDDPADQAERLAEQLVAADPRQAAEVCGGSPEFARQLGYPWPQRR